MLRDCIGTGQVIGRREDLARDLHALRLGLLRSRDGARRMRAESLRGTGVTYVSGIIRYLPPTSLRGSLQFQDVCGMISVQVTSVTSDNR